MRHIVKAREILHMWAHQTQDWARCGNVSFLWGDTPKGHKYWANLEIALRDYPRDLYLNDIPLHLCFMPHQFLEPLYAKAPEDWLRDTRVFTPEHALHVLIDQVKPEKAWDYYFHILEHGVPPPQEKSFQEFLQRFPANLQEVIKKCVPQQDKTFDSVYDLLEAIKYCLPGSLALWKSLVDIPKLDCPLCDSYLEITEPAAKCVNCHFELTANSFQGLIPLLQGLQK